MNLYTPTEAAGYLGCSAEYLRLRRKNEPNAGPKWIMVGASVIYSRADLELFASANPNVGRMRTSQKQAKKNIKSLINGRVEPPEINAAATPDQLDELDELEKILWTALEKIEHLRKNIKVNSQATPVDAAMKINAKQVAILLNCDVTSVYRWNKLGVIPRSILQNGNRKLWLKSDFVRPVA